MECNNQQNTGLKRKTIDKYYTSQTTVDKCIELIKENIQIMDNDICIEPSAGGGAFIPQIKSIYKHFKFYDIQPEHNEVDKLDYLQFNYNDQIKENYHKVHVIGNPPFGRQSSLAIKFIKKSAEYCDSIAFILPKSFKKDSLKKHFPLHFHLKCQYELPNNSFMINDTMYDVPCIFQIWTRENTTRCVAEKLYPKHFRFVKKIDDHDISFRRVGVNAGNIDRNTKDKSPQSHYFIKFDFPFTESIFEKLTLIDHSGKNDTVGPKSISKQELIREFNKVI